MKIVEFSNKYAAQVADMWNKSGSNWGDDDSVKTAEDVILEESKSGNLKLYIAIDNEEVVGYCSFSEYEHDEGASYLPLLNVRPDYHGKKVGKALILRVIEDAIEAPWSRFDLFTWSGNIKAMPLYKKCGFFWEKNNESVHLMNFLPYLYQTEALKGYLEDIDWYQDQHRVIDMNQDGVLSNGHDIFTYNFKNDKTDLTFEFEKSGRGLHYIETPDYSIRMSIPKQELVYDTKYEVIFDITNKSSNTLQVDLEGVNNKNIKSSYNETVIVQKSVKVIKEFTVEKTDKTFDKWKTHPVVEADVMINGKKGTLKLGVNPKSPISVDLKVTQYNHIPNQTYKAYLDLENNLDQETTFDIQFNSSYIEVLNPLSVSMNYKEKRSLTVEYKVKKHGFINEEIDITYNNKTIHKNVKAVIKGHDEIIHGDDEDNIYLVNGNYMVTYDKTHNRVWCSRKLKGMAPAAMMTPQLGMPYNREFSNLKPTFSFIEDTHLQVRLNSKEFEGVTLITNIHNLNGITKVNYEIINEGSDKELAINIPIHKPFRESLVPYNGKILKTNTNEGGGPASLDSSLIDENWIFDREDNIGFMWPKSIQVEVSGWRFAATKENIKLNKGDTFKTEDFVISFNHKDVTRFRAYAGNFDKKEYSRFLSLDINQGNPFINAPNTTAKLVNMRKKKMDGFITTGQDRVNIQESITVLPGYNTFTVDTEDRILQFDRMLFGMKGNVKQELDNGIYTIDNGLITFKVSPEYNDGIYSLQFNGEEWLDSNYPTPKERAWWGTFTGGINVRQSGQQDHVFLKEDRNAEFFSINDNFNNKWEGIKTVVHFEKEEDFKGLIHENYFLTLPGVPVLYTFTKVTNHTGKLINDQYYVRYNVLKVDEDKTKVYYELDGTTYKCGRVGIEKNPKKFVLLQSTREHNLAIYNKSNELEMDTQKAYTILFSDERMTIADGDSKQFTGDFLVLTKDKIKKESLIDLENIKFEV